MSFGELLLIAVGLSMDALAVAVCKGLSLGKIKLKHFVIVGLYFGGFQALMPFIGYLAGYNFQHIISKFDYIIAFVLLAIIGINMIKESRECDEENLNDSFSPKTMIPLAIATSIDALAVGVTLAAMGYKFAGGISQNIFFAVTIIGITTFMISAAGIKIGNVFGTRYKQKSEFAGGLILILIGLKIFAEHFI